MPTGYTADVLDGTITELEPFVWQLARGMGALITMRDAASDTPVPERFEPSQYNNEHLTRLRAERDQIRALTADEADAGACADVLAYDTSRERYLAEKVEGRQRYLDMIAKLEAWDCAPEGIKEFGLDQLQQSLDFDCPENPTYYGERPSEIGEEWRRQKLAKVEQDILFHTRQQAEEEARTEGRNAWLAHLRRSLADHAAKVAARG